MAIRIGKRTDEKKKVRFKRKRRIRSRVNGTAERPRLAVFRSNQHIYVQLVDDVKASTMVSASTLEEELRAQKLRPTIDGAKTIGNLIAKRALAKNINEVVFDRGGYLYHGRIKALAEAAREGGLKF